MARKKVVQKAPNADRRKSRNRKELKPKGAKAPNFVKVAYDAPQKRRKNNPDGLSKKEMKAARQQKWL